MKRILTFVRRIHGHEMKIKSEIAAKSPILKSPRQQLKDQDQYDQYRNCQWYEVQYMLQFMPGDYD